MDAAKHRTSLIKDKLQSVKEGNYEPIIAKDTSKIQSATNSTLRSRIPPAAAPRKQQTVNSALPPKQ